MHPRSRSGTAPDATPPRRAGRLALAAVLSTAMGLSSLAIATPAMAATVPTISAPAIRTGFGPVAITGTADAGETVRLLESASIWNDLQQAVDYDNGNAPVTTVAGSDGTYRFTRNVDSGFLFAVEVNGVRSATRLVQVQVLPVVQLSSTVSGAVDVSVTASPNQPHLDVQVQRVGAAGAWSTLAQGVTDAVGRFTVTLTGQGPGSVHIYRAWIDGDPSTDLTSGYSAAVQLRVAGTPPTPPPPPAPPAPPQTPVGAVQFTRIQYDSPGKDTGTNASLNGEWFRLTNRTTATINLRNWTVRDAGGRVYTFSGNHSLGKGASVHVRTGKGTNGSPAGYRYWGSASYVWNNGGDTATLRDGTRKTIDTCRWTTYSTATNC